MKDKLFDFLRFMAETGLTAIGVAYLGLSTIWHLPYGEEIKNTLIIVSTLLGVFVGVSRANYNKEMNTPLPPQSTFEQTYEEVEK